MSFDYKFVTDEKNSDFKIERHSRTNLNVYNNIHLFYENLETGILSNLSCSPDIAHQLTDLIKWNELKYLLLLFGVMFFSSAFLLTSLPKQTPFSSSKELRGK